METETQEIAAAEFSRTDIWLTLAALRLDIEAEIEMPVSEIELDIFQDVGDAFGLEPHDVYEMTYMDTKRFEELAHMSPHAYLMTVRHRLRRHPPRCPICKSRAIYVEAGHELAVRCIACGLQGPHHKSAHVAAELWANLTTLKGE